MGTLPVSGRQLALTALLLIVELCAIYSGWQLGAQWLPASVAVWWHGNTSLAVGLAGVAIGSIALGVVVFCAFCAWLWVGSRIFGAAAIRDLMISWQRPRELTRVDLWLLRVFGGS